ncbi:MAG: hypothetical protein Q4B67_06240 [Eubacteriales bacterium]|nr:hypothetical protein [Eubacteriales bacterium]
MDKKEIKIEFNPFSLLSRYAALCGVASIVFPFFVGLEGVYTGFIFGAAAISLFIAARKSDTATGAATFGLVMGIIGILCCFFFYASMYLFFSVASEPENNSELMSVFETVLSSYGMTMEDFVAAVRSSVI